MPVEIPCIERLASGAGCPNYALPGTSRCRECQARHERRRREDPSLTGRRGTSAEWRRARGLALHIARRTCKRCHRRETDLRRGEHLEVHHRDGDPSNNRQSNLVVLCASCHRAVERGARVP